MMKDQRNPVHSSFMTFSSESYYIPMKRLISYITPLTKYYHPIVYQIYPYSHVRHYHFESMYRNNQHEIPQEQIWQE
jgi:hypothetical protein